MVGVPVEAAVQGRITTWAEREPERFLRRRSSDREPVSGDTIPVAPDDRRGGDRRQSLDDGWRGLKGYDRRRADRRTSIPPTF